MSDTTLNPKRQKLAALYTVPPFTSLDARSGRWQARKKKWLGVLPELGVGRDVKPLGGWSGGDEAKNMPARAMRGGPSVFDPVLAEVLVHWFTDPGDMVYDPFCGGPTRGLVCGHMGRRYVGFDLRPEQVEANRKTPMGGVEWVVSDSTQGSPEHADAVLTCPPYGPLEKYSSDPADLSNMGEEEYWGALRSAFARSCAILPEGGMSTWVVGSWRRKDGSLADMATKMSGWGFGPVRLYNVLTLWTKTGSAPLRARQFRASRKAVKTHQSVLVFVRGKAKRWHDTPSRVFV